MDVDHGHREDPTAEHAREPAARRRGPPDPTTADDVVTVVDRHQERSEVRVGPSRVGVRQQNQGRIGLREALPDGLAQAAWTDLDDNNVGLAPVTAQQVGQRPRDLLGRSGIALAQHDDPHGGLGQRVTAEVGVKRVEVLVVGRGHPASGRAAPSGGVSL